MMQDDRESRLHDAIRDAERADRELSEKAFSTLKEQYIAAWEATSLDDAHGRERLWQAVQIIAKVQSHLKQVSAGGRLAAHELRQLRTGKKRILDGVL